MADSKLTDLPSITVLEASDVLYVVDQSNNTSSQIIFGNLTDSLLTNSTTFSASVLTKIETNETDIDTLQADQISNNSRIETLSSDIAALSGTGAASSSAVAFGSFNSPTRALADNGFTKEYYSLPNISAGDYFEVTLMREGSLSGVVACMEGLSAGEAVLYLTNNTGVTVNFNNSMVFKYRADRILF